MNREGREEKSFKTQAITVTVLPRPTTSSLHQTQKAGQE